jgi:hypothetical protein
MGKLVITNKRIIGRKGILYPRKFEVPLDKISHIDIKSGGVLIINFLGGSFFGGRIKFRNFRRLRQLQRAYATQLDALQNAPLPNTSPVVDPSVEIVKYKKLLDDGAITEDEYNAKKNQLLGI